MDDVFLEVKNLKKYFVVKGGMFHKETGVVRAVDDVSFFVRKGETFGLVGESGCGKSTVSRLILRLIEADGGSVNIGGQNIFSLNKNEMRMLRSKMQMVFQKPFESLNPRMTIGDIVGSPFDIHKIPRGENDKKVKDLLELVGLNPMYVNRYPHEFSGGQRQRVGIARAIALNPKLIICDEPVSALDVSIQSQILNLLVDLQKKFNLSYIFISHNLSVVKYISTRIGVMYMGKIVEIADRNEIYFHAAHPYTQLLLSAIPIPDVHHRRQSFVVIDEMPGRGDHSKGCRFWPRCSRVTEKCREIEPALAEITPSHLVACHMHGSGPVGP